MRQTKSLVHFEILHVYSKVSFGTLSFLWTKSKSRVRTFFLTMCRKYTKSFFWRKAKSRCFGLGCFFKNIIFRFSKRCSEAREQYFETFRFAPRKISRWKNLFDFQRLKFLYQLVNLVLETCFIFSKTLKLGKTFCLEFLVLFDRSNNERYDSPIPDYLLWNSFQENVNSWVLGSVLQSQLWCPSWIFDTSLSERCLDGWLVKWKS